MGRGEGRNLHPTETEIMMKYSVIAEITAVFKSLPNVQDKTASLENSTTYSKNN